jgi:CspA family cold shock protein
MSPILRSLVLNGASRHKISKGFLLLKQDGQSVETEVRQKLLDEANRYFQSKPEFSKFFAEARTGSSCTIGLATPFLPVYTLEDRENFIVSLHKAINILMQVSSQFKLLLVSAGVNPFIVDAPQGQIPALSADIHQIEVYDDGEIERIYNLFRQFLPELLSVSSHSSVYGSTLQKDFSLRMRVNPLSFLPRYLSQFSVQHLDKIKSMLRRSYGLADVTQMDINPLAGDSSKLIRNDSSALSDQPAAVELRFIDSQISYPFIRAQIILFQAIAMYGRNLARRGRRLPFLRDEIIDENKALAIQNGPGAILVPDPKFSKEKEQEKQTVRKEGYSYHDKGKPERATTALLMIINGILVPSLREMKCEFREIAPIILGAELRKRGRQCFANYAEYQKYLYYTYTTKFSKSFYEQNLQLLSNITLDPITDYNRQKYNEIVNDIEQDWGEKLKSLPLNFAKGRVLPQESGKNTGLEMDSKSEVREWLWGQVANFNREKGFGFIKVDSHSDIFFRAEDILDGRSLRYNDVVSFFLFDSPRGIRAVQIELIESAPNLPSSPKQPRQKQSGIVKWFKPDKHFGYITLSNGKDVFVHESDLKGVKELLPKQQVSFEVVESPKGLKAIRVQVIEEDAS